MGDEIVTNSLSGKVVSSTYKGLLHFPKSLDSSSDKKDVYDGKGTKTSLQLGGYGSGAELTGDLKVTGNLNLTNNLTLNGALTIKDSISSVSSTKFNDITVLSSGNPVSLRSANQIETGNLRIRETTGDYELIFGNPDSQIDKNLFTLKVDTSTNNFFIKNVYSNQDIDSPFWINKTTGEVNIKKLKTDNISNSAVVNGANSNRNTIQVGSITMYAASAAPDGYLKCDGSVYSKNDYTSLYNVIGQNFKTLTTFDPLTGFQVPVIPDYSNNSIIYIIKW